MPTLGLRRIALIGPALLILGCDPGETTVQASEQITPKVIHVQSTTIDGSDVTVLEGVCGPESRISEGPQGEDLSQRRSAYFCDSAIVSVDSRNGNVMFQFSERRSTRQKPIAFAGGLDEPNLLTVERVYLEPGVPLTPKEGFCRLFFHGGAETGSLTSLSEMTCGAQIDEGDRRTVPIIVFRVSSTGIGAGASPP